MAAEPELGDKSAPAPDAGPTVSVAPPVSFVTDDQRACVRLAEKQLGVLSRGARAYYERQSALCDFMDTVDKKAAAEGLLPSEEADADDAAALAAAEAEKAAVRVAVTSANVCNVVLLAIKVWAAVTSGSVAVIASTVDSALDLFSGVLVAVSAAMQAHKNPSRFPVGKARFEPVMLVIFACIMGFASIELVLQGIESLASDRRSTVDTKTLIILGVVIAVKAALYAQCRKLARVSPSCSALALDHLNDVLTNGGTLIAVAIAAVYPSVWWLDGMMCIMLALFMLYNWALTGREQALLLTSEVAPTELLNKLTYVALSHEPARVQFVDTVLAYSTGARVQVEIDIGLPPSMLLREAHDVGEALTKKLESLEDVERAFVHLDFEHDHSRQIEHVCPYSR
jgi:cation diffusion facilitator family transporter